MGNIKWKSNEDIETIRKQQPKTPEELIAELQQQDLDNKEAIAALYEMILGGGASE